MSIGTRPRIATVTDSFSITMIHQHSASGSLLGRLALSGVPLVCGYCIHQHGSDPSSSVTVVFDNAGVGDSNAVNSTTSIRRTRGQITADNAITCTSHATDINDLSDFDDSFGADISTWSVGPLSSHRKGLL